MATSDLTSEVSEHTIAARVLRHKEDLVSSQENVVGSSFESFADAASSAFRELPGDPKREGAAAATVSRLWITPVKGRGGDE